MGQYWLRKARRKYPERKYRFALGQPVYVARQIKHGKEKAVFSIPFTTLEEAKERVNQWEGNMSHAYYAEIRVAYEWEWFSQTKP